jgi:hypothetical protein
MYFLKKKYLFGFVNVETDPRLMGSWEWPLDATLVLLAFCVVGFATRRGHNNISVPYYEECSPGVVTKC